MTPGQAIKLAQEFGEAFLPIPDDATQNVMYNRLTQAANRAEVKLNRQYVLMVAQKDMSTEQYIRVRLAEEEAE